MNFNATAANKFIAHGSKISGQPADFVNVISSEHFETREACQQSVHRLLSWLGLDYFASVQFAQTTYANTQEAKS